MLRVRNWNKYQSYKDRRPPWIRFHHSILDDYTYQMMSAEARALLPMLWLLACEDKDPTSGLIKYPYSEIAFRLRTNEKLLTKTINELQTAKFIECIETVTKPLQNRNETVTPETETEESREETDKRQSKAKYLDCVFLLNEEVDKLINQFGQKGFQDRIQTLNDYIMSKGKKYKSHYHTILNWERRKNQDAPRDGPNQIHISMLPDISADAEKRDIAGLLSGIGKEMK